MEILFIIGLFVIGYLYFDERPVKIIAVHKTDYDAVIIVDRLPYLDKKKIAWWIKNKNDILQRYSISDEGKNGPIEYSIFPFGDGYQPLGKEDRLCFDDMAEPNNCIDKGWLMAVWRTYKGEEKYITDSGRYMQDNKGTIYKVDE